MELIDMQKRKNKREQPEEEIDEASSRNRSKREEHNKKNEKKSRRKLPPVRLGLVKDELLDASPSFTRLLPLHRCEIGNDDGWRAMTFDECLIKAVCSMYICHTLGSEKERERENESGHIIIIGFFPIFS